MRTLWYTESQIFFLMICPWKHEEFNLKSRILQENWRFYQYWPKRPISSRNTNLTIRDSSLNTSWPCPYSSPNITIFFLQLHGRKSGKRPNQNAHKTQSQFQDKKYLTKRNVYCPTLQPNCLLDHSKICDQKKNWNKMYSQILTENDQPETLAQAVDQVLSLFLTNKDRQTFFPPFLRQGGYRHTRFSCV